MIHLHDAEQYRDQGLVEAARRAVDAKKSPQRRPVATQNGGKRWHPATCDHDYTAIESRFLQEVERYKREMGRVFLTLLEVVECAERAGWHRPTAEWSLDQGRLEPARLAS